MLSRYLWLALVVLVGALSGTAVARDAFGVELHPFLNSIVVAYELWLKAGGLYDRALFVEEALPYWRHVFVLLGLFFSVFAVRVSLSHGMTRSVITWMLALFLACLGGVLAGVPPVLPNLVLWPVASIATFFALQFFFDFASRPVRS